MNQRGDGGIRGLLGFDPVALLMDYAVWKLRWAGRRLLTGVVLLVGLGVIAAAFFIPLVLSSLIISVFGLTVEPNKWLGSVLIVGSFVFGFVAAPLILRRVIRRGRAVIALTEFGDDDRGGSQAGPSPIVPQRPTREQWTAGIRALDERLATTAKETSATDQPATISSRGDSTGEGGSPTRP